MDVFSSVLLQDCFVLLPKDLMLGHLFQPLRSGLVVYRIHGAVAFIRPAAREVREALVSNFNYFFWRSRDFTNFLVFR